MILIKDYIFFLNKLSNINGRIKTIFFYNIFSAFLFVCVTLSVPYMLKVVVEHLSQENSAENIYQLLGVILLYSIIWTSSQLLQWVRSLLAAPLIAKCDSISQMLLYLHIIQVRYCILKNMDIGLLYATITRCRTAFSALSFSFIWAIIPVFVQIILGSAVIFIVVGLHQGIVIVISITLLLFSSLYFSSKTTESHIQSFDAQNILSVHFNEKITSIIEIKTHNAWTREHEIIDNISRQYQGKYIQSSNRISLTLIKQSIISGIVFTVTHLFAAWFVYTKSMSLGDFILMSGYVVSLIAPFDAIAASFSDLKKNHLSLQEGLNILNLEKEKNILMPQDDRSTILEVKNYKTPYSHDVINLKLKPGDLALITGTSGRGKTTLLHSIIGLNKDFSGLINLYGCNVKALSPSSISSIASFVQQEPTMFTGTVRDNLLYGTDPKANISDDQLMSVIEGVCLSQLNERDPLNFYVGQKGNKLSGGEKRRLAIARAVMRKLPLMILDEPTSGLDSDTEHSVMSYLAGLELTILLVSHSNNIHQYCSKIIDLDNSSSVT